MKPNIPIALGAGLISAIVFVSATTGPTVVRMIMLAIVSLPVALAGYSYNALTSALAAAIGTLIIMALASPAAGAVFAASAAFPAAILVYLGLLNRATGNGKVEWFPLGQLLLVASAMGATVVGAGLLLGAGSVDHLKSVIRASFDKMLKSGLGGLPSGGAMPEADMARFVDVMTSLLPVVSVAFWLLCILGSQWLGAKVALWSGQLARPWPDLAAFRLPLMSPVLLAAALGASLMLDGLPRLVVLGYAGAVYLLYVLLGLAILHFITRGAVWRGAALGMIYTVLIVFNSGASLILALLGLAESFIPFRQMAAAAHPPATDGDPPRPST